MGEEKKITGLNSLSDWLSNSVTESQDKQYRHRLLKENLSHRAKILSELQSLVHEAHEDARRRLRNLAGNSLDPLDPLAPSCASYPVEEYPKCLDIQTLKGCFGEIFAGVIAEKLSPFGEDEWEVPAFLFRFHITEFQQLEILRQIGGEAQRRPGRAGDDCLAFQRDSKGRIIRSLICEAKCTSRHQSQMTSEAHEKASKPNLKPVDILQLIDILKDYHDPISLKWIESLRQLLLLPVNNSNYERCDLVSYICGLPPVHNKTVIPTAQPHDKYTGGRRLEAVETHFYDVEGLIEAAYNKQDAFSPSDSNFTDINQVWQQVITSLRPPATQALLRQHCHLLAFDGQEARISVSSLPLFREVLRKESNIKDAFSQSGVFKPKQEGEKVKVKLKVVASPKPIATTNNKQPSLDGGVRQNTSTQAQDLPEMDEVAVAARKLAEFFGGEVVTLRNDPELTDAATLKWQNAAREFAVDAEEQQDEGEIDF